MKEINNQEIQKKKEEIPKREIKNFNFGLTGKLIVTILIPLIIGIWINSIISMFCIYYFHPKMIDTARATFLDNYKVFSRALSDSSSEYFYEQFNSLGVDPEIVSRYFFTLYYNYDNENINFKPTEQLLAWQFINGYNIRDNTSLPEYWLNFDDPYGMWFLDPLVRDIINLSLLSKKNIRLCSNMQLILASLYKSVDSEYAYFIGFENDDLLYFYPAKEYKEFKTLIVNISDDCKGKGVIRASCIGSYIEVKKKYGEYLKDPNSDKNPYVLIYFSLPQLYNTNVMITPLCIAFGGMDPELKAIMCIIFYLKQVSDYLSLNSVNKTKSPLLQKPNYFYIVYPDASSLVIFHPDYIDNTKLQYKKSLIELEFNSNYSNYIQETKDFNNKYIKQLVTFAELNDTRFEGEFKKNGVSHYLIATKIFYKVGKLKKFVFALVLVINIEELLDAFSLTESRAIILTQNSLITIIAFVVLLIVLAAYLIWKISHQIVDPINILLKHENKIENGDYETDLLANFELSNLEINTLFITFHKLTGLLKFANEACKKDDNEANAIIHYAEALKFYEDLSNKKGAGIIYNNMGAIHSNFNCFKESIECYKKSIEICKDQIKNEKEFQDKLKEARFNRDPDQRRIVIDADDSDKTLFNLKEVLSNRIFQLAKVYIAESVQTNNQIDNWDTILLLMKEVNNLDKELKLFTSRRITSKIIISRVYFSMSLFNDAFNYIKEAEKELESYEKYLLLNKESIENDHFIIEQKTTDTPSIILKQEIMFQKGLLLKSSYEYKEACKLFTECLQTGKIYLPEIRKGCLENLKEILLNQKLLHKAPNIQKLLDQNFNKKNNDIVFLLDNSESMSKANSNRIDYAIREILKFFDNYMDANDRIGFVRFNQNCYVEFDLQDRGKNPFFLRNSIQNSSIDCYGGTAFFAAIYEGIGLFKKAQKRQNLKWIIALTDGEDNCSKINYYEIYEILKKSDISLIIIGLGLNEDCIEELGKLCKVTKDGVFLESACDSKNIEVAFQTMKKQTFDLYKNILSRLEMNHETLLFTRSKSSNYDIHSAKAKMYSPQPLRNKYNLESLLFSQKHKESSNGLSSHFSSLNSFTPKLLIFEDDSNNSEESEDKIMSINRIRMEINNPQCRDPLFWKEKQEEILDDQVYSTEI